MPELRSTPARPSAVAHLSPAARVAGARHRERSRVTQQLFRELGDCSDQGRRRMLRERLVEANLGVADSIAGRYAGRGVDLDDLEQVARLALVRAVDQFQPDRGHDFLSFAVPTMRGEVRRYFRDHGWVVRPPRRVQEAQARMAALAGRIEQEQGRSATEADYEVLGLDHRTIQEALRASNCYSPDSLDRRLLGDDGTQVLGDRVSAVDDGVEAAEARLLLQPALARLCSRDRLVLRLRFVDGLTQRELGDRIGVTQMQVSRILSRILDELRGRLGVEAAA